MPRQRPQALLLVDGYNIVGAWPELKYTRDQEGLQAARRELVETLINYTAFQGFETQVVFDAQYQDTPGISEPITEHLKVQYTDFGQTADSYIEKTCAMFRNDLRKYEQRLIVATSDRAQQLTVVGYGAECMSANRLAHEVALANRGVRQRQQNTRRHSQKSSSRFLANSLNPEARQILAKLRMGDLQEGNS